MGYMKIPNLYKEQDVLLFRECYVLEKVHGTSARVNWRDGQLTFSSGGAKRERFVDIFDQAQLKSVLADRFSAATVVVYGEAYGGKMQRMSNTYGKELCFIAFEDGCRIIAKHKGDSFRETATPRVVDDPAKMAVLAQADSIAMEWVTPMRLQHVLDKLPGTDDGIGVERTGEVVKAMVADVLEEAGDEIVVTRAAKKAIGKRAADLFTKDLRRALQADR